ncbi:MAG: hypothetical protein F7C07_06520 [Desulfurococcales archaeon]|nr:hypothetical protein [Desulfurococcales archaeon]
MSMIDARDSSRWPTLVRMAVEIVADIERQRVRIPYSIVDKSLESSLLDASHVFRKVASREHSIVRRPFTGLDSEAALLYQYTRAVRARMELAGTVRVHGIHHLTSRIDRFLYRARESLGYDPRIPIHIVWTGLGDELAGWQ